MKKLILLTACMALFVGLFAQNLKSPSEFLGYAIGTKYTPHYRVMAYFQYVAQTFPAQMKYEVYGRTNEGRELTLAYLSSAENFAQLENIRKNNLRLAGMLSDRMAAVEDNAKVIAWLSYNVHGNEPSSSEAAMQTLYELLNPANLQAKEWLKKTVVIIDPMVNPDGRDRYVNWFNSMVGRNKNAHPNSREHIEPWPGGRSNHYNFDLNRDWAWQTQVETQQRIKIYNQWLPHVHADYHEQGYNEPYYFAPAAEPFHEVITNWQREFQTMIGRNNAKYFDEKGWLYFTRERFDLFYPSYGDTYPTYNGSIGMTYEQGGHSRGGLAVETEDGDTLTLVDRVMHHTTTSLSLVEMCSQHAQRTITEFKNFFATARTSGYGDYKTYVVKATANNGEKLQALIDLLKKNDIQFGTSSSVAARGLNYFTGKDEAVNLSKNDLVISAVQPKSALVRVLFEPKSKISDSATYDITAWSMPYAYGLETFGVKEKLSVNLGYAPATFAIATATNAYAYAVPYNSLNAIKFLANLLKQGVRVRYAEQAFESGGQKFEKGTLLVTRSANNKFANNLDAIVSKAAAEAQVNTVALKTGFVDKGFDVGSDRVRMIQTPRVALVSGDDASSLGAGEVWHFFDQVINYPLTVLHSSSINGAVLKNIDVLICPDGYYNFLTDKNAGEAVRNWVSAGGRIVAIEGAVANMARGDWGIKNKEAEKKDEKADYSYLKRYENRERDFLPNYNPGSIYKIELDNSHPLAFGFGDTYYTLKQDANVYEFMKEGWNVGVVKQNNQVAGFTGSKAKEKLKDGLVFGVQDFGRGNIVYMADNPLFRSFWESGKMLLSNAVFLVGQ
jgi:putative lipoic acid-binding regulatory protein